MNKQQKFKNGKLISRGIEWCDYTWNPIAGCKHRCRWKMPDGSTAICYAEEVANKVASKAYSNGFEHHYWHPERLTEPLKLKTPAKIFPDSMSDLFGAWVPPEHLEQVLDVMRQANWHIFQSLTKAPTQMVKYQKTCGALPQNLWAGASVPPSEMFGKPLSYKQQERMLHSTLTALSELKTPVRWLSIEPLSFDVSPILRQYPDTLEWAVIGAASNGRKLYQPKPEWVENTLQVLDEHEVAVFFKGNLKWTPWREDFPTKQSDLAIQIPVTLEVSLF